MNRLVSLVGHVLDGLSRATLLSFTTYRAQFLASETRDILGRLRAGAAFDRARRRVPAYRDFLSRRHALAPKSWADVPPMDKRSYISAYPIEALCDRGRLPLEGAVLDESSGHGGEATNWVRSRAERRASGRLIQHAVRQTFGDEGFVLVNAFALGPWATGLHVSMSLVDRCIVKSTGPDIGKILATLRLLGPRYRYVIAGYPPFLKTLVDASAGSFDWLAFDVSAVVGGESMSEALRTVLLRSFRRVVSSFGASDLEINIASESPFTIALRRELGTNEQLLRDLCGTSGSPPMIFHYDPFEYFIEQGSERRLFFTLNRLGNASPRVRYDLDDRGVTRTLGNVLAILRDHRVKLDGPPPLPLPLLFHEGRADNVVVFFGANLTPSDLGAALLRVPRLASVVERHAFHLYEDDGSNKRLDLWVELHDGASVPTADVRKELEDEVLGRLAEENQDFREALRMMPIAQRPTLRLFLPKDSPLAGQDQRIKRRYIL